MATRKTPSAQSFAAEAHRQFDELRSALRAARASLANISRAIRSENIKILRHKIPKSTTGGLSLFETIGATLTTDFLGGEVKANAPVSGLGSAATTSSFYRSSSQLAGSILDAAIRGQRIR